MPQDNDGVWEDTGFPTDSVADWVFKQLKTFAAEGKLAQVRQLLITVCEHFTANVTIYLPYKVIRNVPLKQCFICSDWYIPLRRKIKIFAGDGSTWTYEDLLSHSVHVAAGLQSVGINAGDMVSFVTRNSHEMYAVVLGCIMSDVTVAPSIAESPPKELLQNFLAVDAKLVIAESQFIPAVQEAVSTLNPKPRIFEIRQLFKEATAKGAQADPATFKPVRIADPKNHVFLCLFTSGTTGKQKAAALIDYGFLRNMYLISRFQLMGDTGIAFNWAQMHWLSWWLALIRGLFRGLTRIVTDKNGFEDILDAIHKFKPSSISGPPFALYGMAQEIDRNPFRWDVSSIRGVFSGGDNLEKAAHKQLSDTFQVPIYQGYGSTEGGFALMSQVNFPVVHGSVGKPLVPLKLVDMETGKEITTPNTPGEIALKWMIFREYINNSEATANSLDENGWFKSGDIAVFDKSGNFFIVDRVKEMFKYRISHISPSELEGVIKRLPGVKDVGVAGKHAGVGMDLPTAIVVKSAGSTLSEKDIIDFVENENLDDAKRLRGGVIFTNEIPRNVNGKIVRQKLKALLN